MPARAGAGGKCCPRLAERMKKRINIIKLFQYIDDLLTALASPFLRRK